MLDALFGAEVPLAVRFFIAFLIVLALIGGTAWIVRRFGANRFGSSSSRGRQPRLAVIDAAQVDGRRRLVLIRRDNVEHLLIIGGPTDVVVEQNIVRAAPAAREPAPPRAAPPAPPADTLPRAVPLGESNWPLQPEPMTRPVRPMPLESAEQWQPEPPPQPPRPPEPRPAPSRRQPRGQDTLAGLAEELAARVGLRPEGTRQSRPAEPAPPPPSQPRAPSPQAEQNLADMAVRLESALRRPAAAAPAQPTEPPAAPEPSPPPAEASTPAEEEVVEPAPAPTPEPLPAAAAKTPQAKSLYESLEQEMASLLARPPGKPDKPGKS